jgi:hypothetical protein
MVLRSYVSVNDVVAKQRNSNDKRLPLHSKTSYVCDGADGVKKE